MKATCSECGSTDVEIRAWVHQETDAIDYSSSERDDFWCNKCQDHVLLDFDSETPLDAKKPVVVEK